MRHVRFSSYAGGEKVGTTIAHLLCKICKPQEGVIELNGVDFNLIPRTELRDFITYVPNNSMIVDGTIRDNLKVR